MADGYKTSDGKVFYESDNAMAKYQAEDHQRSLGGSSNWQPSGTERVTVIAKAGVDAIESGDFDSAIAQCTNVINDDMKIKGEHAVAYINRACAYLEKGDYKKAIDDYTMGIGIGRYDLSDASFGKAFCNRGVAYGKLGEDAKAIADYKIAADCGDENALKILANKGIQHKPNANSAAKEEALSTAFRIQLDAWKANYNSRQNKPGSSSTSSTSGGSILFNIIGAIVVAIIGFNILGWLGLIGGAVGGFFLGKWLSAKIIGKILLIVALVVIGGGFIISKLPSKPATATTETTATEEGK